LLSLVLSPSLKDHVGSTEHLSNSVEWKLRYEIEWSVDVETEFFIESLSLNLWSLVKIEYSPSLGNSSIVFPYLNSVTFLILASSYIKDSVVVSEVHELLSSVLEQLPPS